MQLSEDGESLQGQAWEIDCTIVANSGGWTPSCHMYSQSGGKLQYNESLAAFVPDYGTMKQTRPSLSAGACNGSFNTAECIEQGARAGADAAGRCGLQGAMPNISPVTINEFAQGDILPLWLVPTVHPVGEGKAKHFHDFQNDVTAADIHLAAREGFCLLYTSPSPRDGLLSRMPSSA